MDPCEDCTIEEKIYQCCGRFPETGERSPCRVPGYHTLLACPHLDSQGRCDIYENRPMGCRQFHCDSQLRARRGIWTGFGGF
ncbi:MAG: hypothetical protein JXA20_01800 [Spirochaetes bacterium]|nr:hypothetical protein [Spirochaetota bacterium]